MGKIVVTALMSLDGVLLIPREKRFEQLSLRRRLDAWDATGAVRTEAPEARALLVEHATYEHLVRAGHERRRTLHDEHSGVPTYVLSSTLLYPQRRNTHVIRGCLAEEVNTLKQNIGGDIHVPASFPLVWQLIRRDLVDEMRLTTYPVILGTGKRLFGGVKHRKAWELIRMDRVGGGLLVTVFRRPGR